MVSKRTQPIFGPQLSALESTTTTFDMRSAAHVLLLAIAAWIFSWSVALDAGILGCVLGAAMGAIAGQLWTGKGFRTTSVLMFAVLIAFVGYFMTTLVSDAVWLSLLLTPAIAFETADAIQWFTLLFGGAAVIRALAVRYRSALALEGGIVVAAIVTSMSAHRDGMIARPLGISDWFWSQGVDPVIAFLFVGLLAGLLLASVLAHGRSKVRTSIQMAMVLIVGLILIVQIYETDTPPEPRSAAGGKLEQDDDERSSKQGNEQAQAGQGEGTQGSGGQKGRSNQEDKNSPFEDGMPRGSESNSSQKKQESSAIVVFHRDIQPSMGVYYFRHATFSQYNGSRLVEPTDGRVPKGEGRDFPTRRRLINGIHENAPGREMVATDVALIRDHARMFTLTDAIEVSPNTNPSPARFKRSYHVVSNLITKPYRELMGSDSGDPSWEDELWNHYTAVPRDERYHRLSAKIQGGLKSEYQSDSFALAMAVKAYLESNATYSFKKSYADAPDPTAAFLFSEEKLGYCVHLSHAAAYLLRAMGIPSRVSAGYAVESKRLNGGSSLLVKASDAHAWAEIYLRGYGWVPVEVTPEKTDTEPNPFAEKDLQQLLGEMARNQKNVQGPPPAMDFRKIFDTIRMTLPWVLLSLLMACYFWKFWRLWSPHLFEVSKRPKLAYRAALDRLSAVGKVREYGESREKFALRVRELSPSIKAVTDVHIASALGSRRVKHAQRELETLHLVADSVGREVRDSMPRWRWVLGVINPVSWIWSR